MNICGHWPSDVPVGVLLDPTQMPSPLNLNLNGTEIGSPPPGCSFYLLAAITYDTESYNVRPEIMVPGSAAEPPC